MVLRLSIAARLRATPLIPCPLPFPYGGFLGRHRPESQRQCVAQAHLLRPGIAAGQIAGQTSWRGALKRPPVSDRRPQGMFAVSSLLPPLITLVILPESRATLKS